MRRNPIPVKSVIVQECMSGCPVVRRFCLVHWPAQNTLPLGWRKLASILYPFSNHWGISGELSFQNHTYNVKKAGEQVLDKDIRATSVRIDAGSYHMLYAGLGPYYTISPVTGWHLTLSSTLGISSLTTPEIIQEIRTVPHTQNTYTSGTANSFYYGATLRSAWDISPRLGAGILAGLGCSKPAITGGQGYPLSYTIIRSGIELRFRL
jgi:hypothetical protein